MNFKKEYGVDLEDNQVISCKTQEQATRVVNFLHKRGCNFPAGKEDSIGAFGLFEDNLCYLVVEENGELKAYHRDRSYFPKKDFYVVKAEKFLLKNDNPEPRYKKEDVVSLSKGKKGALTVNSILPLLDEVLYGVSDALGAILYYPESELEYYVKEDEASYSAEEKLNASRLLREFREWEQSWNKHVVEGGEPPVDFDGMVKSVLRRYIITKR
jgi:hypothetical protein